VFLLVVDPPPLGPGVVPLPAVFELAPAAEVLPAFDFLFGYILF